MEAPLLIAIVAAVLAVAAAYFAMRSRGTEAGAAPQNDMLTDLREAAAENDRRLAVATTQLAEIQSQFATAAAERDRLRETEIDLITQVEVQKKEIELQNVKLKDWEEAQRKFMEGANAALAESATKLSSKLLEDHKREAVAAKEDSEKRVKKATEELFKQFVT